jgi:hypothetical protein
VRSEVLAEAIEALGGAGRPLTPVARVPASTETTDPTCREQCQGEIDKIKAEVGGIRDDLAKWRKEQQAWQVLVESRVDANAKQIKAIPVIEPEQFVPREQYRAERDSQNGVVAGLKKKIEGVAATTAEGLKQAAGRKLDEVAVGALGMGGPIGIGLAVGLWFARRKVRSVIQDRRDEHKRGDGQGAAPQGGFQG